MADLTLAERVDTVLDYYAKIYNASRPKYECWDGGAFNHDGSPAWAVDRPHPDPADVRQMFCAGLVQLGRRRLDLPITKHDTMPIYNGGMASLHDYFHSVAQNFQLGEFERGDIAYVPFGLRGANFEGHVGVATGGPDDPFWQSFAYTCRYLEPGLNKRWTLRESHDGGFYTLRVPRRFAWTPKSRW